jgi:hypothetical protein
MSGILEQEFDNIRKYASKGRQIEAVKQEDGTFTAQKVRMGATGLDLEPPIQTPLQTGEPQTKEQTAKEFVPALAGAATGPAVGAAEVVDLGLGLVKGAYKAAFPDADEGRFESFMQTLGDQFESGYGEGARSMILDIGRRAGYDEEQLKVMDEGITAGSFFGYGGAVKAAPKVASAIGDAVEGAGDAAKARMADADGSVTLTSGVDPDPAIAALGDAVKAARAKYEASPNDPNARRTYLEARRQRDDKIAKFKAPTETEPGIIAFHGSGKDFDEFLLKYIGTGAKANQYGHGLYFSDFEDVATYFRGIASPNLADYKLNDMSVTDMYNRAQNTEDYEKAEVLEQVLLHDRPDEIAKRFTVEEGYSPETQEFASSINYDTLKGIDPDGNEVSLGRTYKVELGINKDNMLDWQEPLKNQPDDIIQKVRSLVDEDLRDTFDYNVEKGIAGGNAYLNYIGKNKKEASEKLAALGIDGIKYKDIGGTLGYTLENAPTNYVVFNPQAIKILEKYGIVGPVAITGVAATKQEGKSDGRTA